MPLGVSQDPADLDPDNLAWQCHSFINNDFTQYKNKSWKLQYKVPHSNT